MSSSPQTARRSRRPLWLLLGLGFALFLLVTSWLARSRYDSGSVDLHEREVAVHLARRDLARAEQSVEEWLRAAPRSPEAWAARTLVELHAGQAERAEKALATARSLGLSDERHDTLRLVLLERTGRATEAEPELIRIIARSNRPPAEAYESLARIFLSTYRLRQASIVLDRWVRDYPRDPRPFLMMTEIDERTDGGAKASVAHYREALERAPALVEAHLGLAEALRKDNQVEAAIAEYDAFVLLQPDDTRGLIGRAQALLTSGEQERATRDLSAALAKEPDHAEALRLQAGIDLTEGNAVAALERVDRALSAWAFDAEAHYLRARALDRLGRGEEAEVARARSVKLREDEEALRVVQRKFNENPADDGLRCQIARWMIEHGQGPQGERWIRTILARDPRHVEANRLLADYYESTGRGGLANFHRLQAGGGPSEAAGDSGPSREGS